MVDTRTSTQAPPEILWSEPLGPHAVENVGTADLHVIGFEIKSQ